MPSTYTASLRFEMQGTGENLNAWGTRLNTALGRIDKAIAGRTAITLAGATYILSSLNTADDEARSAILDFSGVGGCSVVIPSLTKTYLVRNTSNGVVTLTTGAGPTVALGVNDACVVFCDGSSVYREMIAGVSFKAYVDNTAWTLLGGYLPGQTGNAGKALLTDGATPSWTQLSSANLSDKAVLTGLMLAL